MNQTDESVANGEHEAQLLAMLRELLTEVPVAKLLSVCATFIGLAIKDFAADERAWTAAAAYDVIRHHAGISRMPTLENRP